MDIWNWLAIISGVIAIYFLCWMEWKVRKDGKGVLPARYYWRQFWIHCRRWMCKDIIMDEMVQALHPDFGYIWQEDGEGWRVHQQGIQEGRLQVAGLLKEVHQSHTVMLNQWMDAMTKIEERDKQLGEIAERCRNSKGPCICGMHISQVGGNSWQG